MEKLINLVREFDHGDIALPIMQRDFVWRPRKVELFLDSLYRGWPVGSFYLWRPTKRQSSKNRDGKTQRVGESVRYLLDGQQRLASLSRAITNEGGDLPLPPPGRTQGERISWRAFFDVVNQNFYLKGRKKSIKKRIDKNDPGMVALSDIILMDDPRGLQRESNVRMALDRLIEGARILDTDSDKDETRARLTRVARMLDIDVMCQEIETFTLAKTPADEVKVAIEIFQRLNSGGMSLSAGDVAAANLAQETTASILGPMRDFAKDRVCISLGLNFVFLFRALVTIRCGTSRVSKLPKRWASDPPPIEESWELTRKSLHVVTELVDRIGWADRRWLPSANALLPVAYFASQNGGRILKENIGEAVRFLCLAAWTGAFSGAPETAIDHYVRHLQRAGQGCSAKVLTQAIPKSRLSRVGQEDVQEESKMAGALSQIYLAYLVSRGAKSWPSGRPLADVCKNRECEVHHIFPRKFMERVDSDRDVNTLANYAMLSKDDHGGLGDNDPQIEYGKLSADQKRVAQSQFIPFGDDEALLPEAYPAFTERRAKNMAKALNEFMGL